MLFLFLLDCPGVNVCRDELLSLLFALPKAQDLGIWESKSGGLRFTVLVALFQSMSLGSFRCKVPAVKLYVQASYLP